MRILLLTILLCMTVSLGLIVFSEKPQEIPLRNEQQENPLGYNVGLPNQDI